MPERHDIPFEIDQFRVVTHGVDALMQMRGVITADFTYEPDTRDTPGVSFWEAVAVPSIEYLTLIDEEGREVELVVNGKDTDRMDVDRVLADWINEGEFNEWLDQLGRDHIS